jgi:peptidoglycan hydrolase CwlO-like protein
VIYRRICAALLPLMLSACASDPAPNEQLRLTEQALSQAKEKLAQAQAALQGEDYKQARVYAEQAELDARLAEAEHLTEKSQQQLVELSNTINRLRKQLGGLQ